LEDSKKNVQDILLRFCDTGDRCDLGRKVERKTKQKKKQSNSGLPPGKKNTTSRGAARGRFGETIPGSGTGKESGAWWNGVLIHQCKEECSSEEEGRRMRARNNADHRSLWDQG